MAGQDTVRASVPEIETVAGKLGRGIVKDGDVGPGGGKDRHLLADAAGIQFRLLNRRKGPAVRATRAQEDRVLYRRAIRAMKPSA